MGAESLKPWVFLGLNKPNWVRTQRQSHTYGFGFGWTSVAHGCTCADRYLGSLGNLFSTIMDVDMMALEDYFDLEKPLFEGGFRLNRPIARVILQNRKLRSISLA